MIDIHHVECSVQDGLLLCHRERPNRSCICHGWWHAVGGSRSLHGIGDPRSRRTVCSSRCHVGGGCSWRCVGGCSGLHGISDRRSWRAVGGSRCHVGGSRSRCGVGDGGRLCSVGDRCSRCSICDSRGLHSRHYCCWSSVSDSWCLCHRWCRSSVGHSRSLHWRCVCDRCCNFNRGGCIGRCRCRIRDGRCRRRCVSHLRCCICGGNWLGWSCCWHRVCGGRSCIGCSRHKRSHRRCCNCGWSCICHCRCHGWCCIGHSWRCAGSRHHWSRSRGRIRHGRSRISHGRCCDTTHRCIELCARDLSIVVGIHHIECRIQDGLLLCHRERPNRSCICHGRCRWCWCGIRHGWCCHGGGCRIRHGRRRCHHWRSHRCNHWRSHHLGCCGHDWSTPNCGIELSTGDDAVVVAVNCVERGRHLWQNKTMMWQKLTNQPRCPQPRRKSR
mmetsp:Transcript_147807/g.411630  ORF Transcript_147807/g.411630 Transcript_147807/m.411630 type:complete len:442 (+) Transcript_147807:1546-2871(+)